MKVLALTGVIMFTGFAGTATAQENNKKDNKTEIEYGIGDAYLKEGDFEDFKGEPTTCVIGIEDMKFEELYPGIEKVMGKEDVAKAKKIFEDIKNLEKDGKFEESSKLWENLEKIVKKYSDALRSEEAKNMKFEDYVMGIKDEITKEDMAKAEKLFNEAKSLLVAGKIDEGYNKLDEMYKLTDKYYGGNDIIMEPGTNFDMNFEDMYGYMNELMSKEDKAKAKSIFENIKKLEKDSKYEESAKLWEDFDKIILKYEDQMKMEDAKNLKFDEIVMGIKDKMSKEELAKAEKLFNEAKALLIEGKVEEGCKKLEEIYKATDKYYPDAEFIGQTDKGMFLEAMNFEDFYPEYKKYMNENEIKEAKEIFKNIQKLEKEEKFEESQKLWEKLDEITNKYSEKIQEQYGENFIYEDMDKAEILKNSTVEKR